METFVPVHRMRRTTDEKKSICDWLQSSGDEGGGADVIASLDFRESPFFKKREVPPEEIEAIEKQLWEAPSEGETKWHLLTPARNAKNLRLIDVIVLGESLPPTGDTLLPIRLEINVDGRTITEYLLWDISSMLSISYFPLVAGHNPGHLRIAGSTGFPCFRHCVAADIFLR